MLENTSQNILLCQLKILKSIISVNNNTSMEMHSCHKVIEWCSVFQCCHSDCGCGHDTDAGARVCAGRRH